MFDTSFITLHRKILKSSVFDDAELFKVWVWCLVRANHKDTNVVHSGQVIKLKRGDFITGRFTASDELNMSADKFRKRIAVLEELGQITKKTTNRFTIISIVKYSYYQGVPEKTPNRTPTEPQQNPTDNTGNNVNNSKGEQSSPHLFEKDMAWKQQPGDGAEVFIDADSGEEIKPKEKPKRHYKEVYTIFEEVLGKLPTNWFMNTTQQKCAENLFTERGLKAVRNALEFYKANKEEEFCPLITQPSDLDAKWTKLAEYKKRSS